MTNSDVGARGVITAGAAFELQQPAQVHIAVLAKCASARNAFLETTLEFVSSGAAAIVVSRTDVSTPTESAAANGATLRLPGGKYRWSARFGLSAGGAYSAPNIESGRATLYHDIDNLDVIGQCSVYGSSGGFALVSARIERPLYAKARLSGSLAIGERLQGALRIIEVPTMRAVTTPTAEIMGPTGYPLETEASPYFIKANTLYKVSYDMNYQGSAPITASITTSS